MTLNKTLLFFICLVALASCKKDDNLEVDDIPGLGGDEWVANSTDKWIYDNLTKPFNISVKYKWDPHEVSDQYILRDFVPAKEEVLIPLMESVKKVWADNYIAEKDSVFFKRYAAKFFSLFGSAIYNVSNGTKVLGIAEGGKKINLLEVNTFKTNKMAGYKASDSTQAKMAFHTVHHEAAHILHQTVLYPLEYKRINVGMYTTNWVNYTDQVARQDGFITAYSMQDPNEDFVEMVSMMLVEGRGGFNAMLASINAISEKGTTPDQARAKLRLKESIVVNYFKTVWGIDFYSLQTRVRAAVESYIY
ncbi:substrate import-associated zinc metallohydrolase lipoprotein [Filimonas effusa]|uniref:Substrate import-associated zinc metallohydrolase lipoprotein n=1 Tax=Filimonas effusa TaxID=2508721 RepID=A0A4Q1DAR6_9BACT|nr:substrate import-associated zinc metallohydrolase lipoprotein [Filimonas effusa]RXK86501.1 hypothetical protein ESB13_06755 [Filimonas effusa]